MYFCSRSTCTSAPEQKTWVETFTRDQNVSPASCVVRRSRMVGGVGGMWVQNFDQEFNSWFFKLAAALIDYWVSASLQDQSIPHWTLGNSLLTSLPAQTANHSSPLQNPSLPAPIIVSTSFKWQLSVESWQMTDPDVLIGRCQPKRNY